MAEPISRLSFVASSPFAHEVLSAKTGALGAFYAFSWLQVVYSPLYLDGTVFHQSFVLGSTLSTSPYSWFLLANLILAFSSWRRLRWQEFDAGSQLRIYVSILTMVLTWTCSCYDVNLYLDRTHTGDRLLISALGLACWWHPIAVPFFLVACKAMLCQFYFPGFQFSLTDKRLLLDMLILFNVFLYWRLFCHWRIQSFLFCALCLIGMSYVEPGLAKLRLSWEAGQFWGFHNDLGALVANAHWHGAWAFLDEQTLRTIRACLDRIQIPIMLATLAIELGALFLVFHRRLAAVSLLSVIGMQVGIFLATCIFFWKWIVVVGAMAIWLWRRRDDFSFGWAYGCSGVMVILLGIPLVQPVSLGWWDTPLTRVFDLEVVGESGKVYPVPRSYLAPFDLPFAQNEFFLLCDSSTPTRTWGATASWEAALAVRDIVEAEDPELALSRLPATTSHELVLARHADFLYSYFSNLNSGQFKQVTPRWLSSPHHIWTWGRGETYHGQEKIVQVRTRHKIVLTGSDSDKVLEDRIVQVVQIDTDPPKH